MKRRQALAILRARRLLRALAPLALTLSLVVPLGARAQAAAPLIDPSPVSACDPCVTVVDRPAWDEEVTVVDAAAYDEAVTVVDVPATIAYRTVVDRPAATLAHHDLVTPERTRAYEVLVEDAHWGTAQEWVATPAATHLKMSRA